MGEHIETIEEHTETSSTSTKKESNVSEIETALLNIASGLQSAAEAYVTLASHIPNVETSEIPQLLTQIPSPPIPVPTLIRKALTIDDEKKVVNYMICREYELTKTSWSKLQKNIMLAEGESTQYSKEKACLEDHNTNNDNKRNISKS